ncbi:MAG: threonylcarbamoyl-AMP synthase [Bacillales bacterium]|jgi:L-threonylcarbamoyladenylate synthase|nr:threonylcarbamoyl-AMP synthase [Bacillales bacterium]
MITNDIQLVIDSLQENKVVCIPTDTVFGLAVSYNKEGFETLKKIKNRENKPFSLLVKDLKMLKKYCVVDNKAQKIINTFLPGALTIVLPSLNNETIGIRIIDHHFIKTIFEQIDFPLYLTSANLSGEPLLNSLEEIEKVFPDVLIINSNHLNGMPSTVVKQDKDNLLLLREGSIPFCDILNIWKETK